MPSHFSRPLALLATASVLLPFVAAQTYCNSTLQCPSANPCCSEYGFCGKGSFCLNGCEPNYSYSLTSCKPAPICQSGQYTFYNTDRIQLNESMYNGNASQYDWVVNAGQLVQTGYGVQLVLNQTNSGTKISSTRYVHYGTISFVMEASKWAGVVSAAITMSDVKDEIDWEWAGAEGSNVQTNYWFLGIANYSNTQGQTVNTPSDTGSNFHTYTLDWQPEYLTWMVDGNVVRTVNKSSTLAPNGQTYQYPSTPSRIQISIWPGGIAANAPGTVEWAGGMINWQDPDYVSTGYFWNTLQSVNVTCNADPSQTSSTTGWAYIGNSSAGVPMVGVTNASTINGAGRAVGLDTSLSGIVITALGALLVGILTL